MINIKIKKKKKNNPQGNINTNITHKNFRLKL